jgi:hypothetical protein
LDISTLLAASCLRPVPRVGFLYLIPTFCVWTWDTGPRTESRKVLPTSLSEGASRRLTFQQQTSTNETNIAALGIAGRHHKPDHRLP